MSAVADPRRATKRLGSVAYLRTHWRLLLRVARTDLAARHAGSHLGLGWVFLAPLLVLVIYAVVYLEIFRVRVEGLTSAQYVVYIFCGLVPFLAAAESISSGVTSVIQNKAVLNNTVFPIDLAPVKCAVESQAIMAVGTAIVFLGVALTHSFHWTLVLLPLIWVLNLLFLIGVNWILAPLNVVFRDLQSMVTAILMVLLVASPIAYTPDMVPDQLRFLLGINPFAYYVVGYQQVIMLGIVPSLWHWVLMVLAAVLPFALGSWLFAKAKAVIVDYV